ncbi:hypothetical protein PQ478_08270 [Alkalihalophilus pseudofirmus]|uniref:hypothetical protein n=1 Tax=Alkalihalophilus pseudofirmus TaxID=79885 RepID=UPI00259B7091|nr:hypothetical protein [Alkalihalophilus pseudofirmus]WEG18464.1 hypothetical protein PQ478_08270 [Alkalihalophilus pseudofirmus]
MQNETRKYIESLNNEFTEIVGGSYVKLSSGELFTQTEVKKYVKKKLEEYTSKFMQDIKQQSNETFEVVPEQRLINHRSMINMPRLKTKDRYDGGEFNMVYRNKINEVIAMKLSNNEKLVFFTLRDFITYPTNCILINNEVPKFPDYENIVGLKERTIRKVIKSLEDKGLFKLKQHGHKKAIYVNPSYYASGKELDIEVLQMFDLIDCDDRKIEEYL